MKKQRIRDMFIGALVTAMLFVTSTSLLAAQYGDSSIDVSFRGIKVYMDDKLLDLKDASGATVEPFIYKGTTYLPVRSVAESLDKAVTWDGNTNSVYLGKHETNTPSAYLHNLVPYLTDGDAYTKLRFKDIVYDAYGSVWNNVLMHYSQSSSNGRAGWMEYDFEGKYSKMKGFFVLDERAPKGEAVFRVSDVNGKVLYTSKTLEPGMAPIEFEIDLDYATKVRVEIIEMISTGEREDFGIADVKLYQ